MLSKYRLLNNLTDSLDELQVLHDELEWDRTEVTVLRAMVKIQEVVRDMEMKNGLDDYDELSEQLGGLLEEVTKAQDELNLADDRIAELETELGSLQAKSHTVEQVEDEGAAPDMFGVGDRVNDHWEGPGTIVNVDHASRSCDIVFDDDYTGYSPVKVAFKNLEFLTEDTAELTDEMDEDPNPRELPLARRRFTDWGREVIEDFNGRNLTFQMGDKVKDTLTMRTGVISGYVEEGSDFRYEISVDDEMFGNWQIYGKEYHLQLVEEEQAAPAVTEIEADDEVFEYELDDIPHIFD